MKIPVLLVLLLPLHAFAQFGRGYTGPTMQQNQQSRQYFNQMTNQRSQEFRQRQLERHTAYGPRSSSPSTAPARLQAQAKQQQLEQEANESVARLTQQQQQQRQEHPAKNAQLAAAQQKADDKQLTLLTVKNYREVFLPAQVAAAQDAQQLAPGAQQRLQNLTATLLDDAWWGKQEGAQLPTKVKAYGDTLTSLTTGLLGFDLATPPAKAGAHSASDLDDKLKKGSFDQNAAAQLIREAALRERLAAGDQLAKTVQDFAAVSAAAPQSEPKKLRKDVQKGLRAVTKEMTRYNDRIAASDQISSVESALRKSTTTYLVKNSN